MDTKRTSGLFLILLTFVGGFFLASDARALAQTAVLPVLGYGLPSDRVSAIEAALLPAVHAAAGGVLGAEETRLLLEAAESTLQCQRAKMGCLVELGGLMAVQRLVLVIAKQTEAGTEITLTVIDVAEARQRRRLTQVLTAKPAQEPAQIRTLVFRLFHDSAAILGGLIVNVHEPGAEIFVDGKSQGFSPLKRSVQGLAQGQHEVRVVLEGQAPALRTVDVGAGALVQIRVRVVPEVAPTTQGVDFSVLRTFGWSVLGVGGGGTIIGLLGSLVGLGLTALAFTPFPQSVAQVFAFIAHAYGCYDVSQTDVPCRPADLRESRANYDRISAGTQWAAVVGIPFTALIVLSFAGIVAGAAMLLFARYQELSQRGYLGLPPPKGDPNQEDPNLQSPQTGREDPGPAAALSIRIAHSVRKPASEIRRSTPGRKAEGNSRPKWPGRR